MKTKQELKDEAYEEYKKIVDPAWEEYEKIIGLAWEEYCPVEHCIDCPLYNKNSPCPRIELEHQISQIEVKVCPHCGKGLEE